MADTPSQRCLDLIKISEGFSAKAYWDEDGYTVGYGHHGDDVQVDTVWTEQEADDRVQADAAEAARLVLANVKPQLDQGQLDALTDFVFNEGIGHFEGSTLRRLINAGAPVDTITAEFGKWDKAGQKTVLALQIRRQREVELYTTGDWNGGPGESQASLGG